MVATEACGTHLLECLLVFQLFEAVLKFGMCLSNHVTIFTKQNECFRISNYKYGIKDILQVVHLMDLVSSKHNNQVHNTIESTAFKGFEAHVFLGLLRFLTNQHDSGHLRSVSNNTAWYSETYIN